VSFNKYYYYIPTHYGESGGSWLNDAPTPLLLLDTGNINDESKIIDKCGWLKKLHCMS